MRARGLRRTASTWGWLTAVVVLCVPGVGQKEPDVQLDNTVPPGFSNNPAIAASGSRVYVTWEDNRHGRDDIYFNRSFDGGATWLPSDVRLDTDARGATDSEHPQVATTGAEVYVLWWDRRGGASVYFNRSLDGGSTWLSSDVRLDSGPGRVQSIPRIAVAGHAVYAIWNDRRNGSGIFFNRSLDRGSPGSWLTEDVELSASGDGPEILAVDSKLYATWKQRGIHFNRSLDRGATWLPSSARLDSGPGPTLALPQIAASDSAVYVAWPDDRSGRYDIHFNRSLDEGATWLAADIRLNTNPAGQSHSTRPVIAASGAAVYVAWEDDRSNPGFYPFYIARDDIYINRSLDRGSSWLAEDIRLDTDPPGWNISAEPAIAAAGSGVYVTWTDFRNGYLTAKSDIYFNRSLDLGATWLGSDVRLDTNAPASTTSQFPGIAATGSSVYVAWKDYRGSQPGIYFNIPFGFHPYGAATAGSGGIAPVLASTGSATIGSAPAVAVTNGLGGAAGVVLLGRRRAELPLFGGALLVVPELSVPISLGGAAGVPGSGSASLPLLLPNTESIIGLKFDFQGLFLDAGAPQGVSMTNGVELWIG